MDRIVQGSGCIDVFDHPLNDLFRIIFLDKMVVLRCVGEYHRVADTILEGWEEVSDAEKILVYEFVIQQWMKSQFGKDLLGLSV